MSTSSTTDFELVSTPWNRRAWATSLAAHAALVLLLGWMLREETEAASDPPDRPAAIVLAQRGATGETTYVSPADETDEQRAVDPLPPPGELAARTDVDLPSPKEADVKNTGDGLVQSPKFDVARQQSRLSSGRGDADVLADDPIRNRPPPPPGEPVEVSPFGATAQGRSFVFLIDRSQSMGALGALAAAEDELATAIGLLEPEHRFQIIAYNRTLDYFERPGMPAATTQNKDLAGRFLRGLIAASGTEHRQAVLAGLRQKADVIFLLTDGGDPPLTPGQVRQIARDNTHRTSVHCIHFRAGSPQDDAAALELLARLNGGTYRRVDVSQFPRRR